MLIYQYKESIIQSPSIIPLDRVLIDNEDKNNPAVSELTDTQLESVSYSLKGSGRIIRKIDTSPPMSLRNWKPITCLTMKEQKEHALAGQQLIAETLYIIKPIVHLISSSCFGNNTWTPWLIALSADVVR